MRVANRRKAQNKPCKSPSPDINAKAIIKNTTIEVEQIKSKIKTAEEKELKFELESSYSQVVQSELNISTENKYRQLVDQISKLKNENKHLVQQNQLLNQENKRFVLQDERSKTISQLTGALLLKTDKEPLREKLLNLDEGKRKLQRQLEMQKQKNEQSQRNIQGLRLEIIALKDQLSRLTNNERKIEISSKIYLAEQEKRLTLLSNSIFSNFSQTFKAKVDSINSRINKVELMQKIIKEQHSRIIMECQTNKTPSSSFKSQSKQSYSTTGKLERRWKDDMPNQYVEQKSVNPFSSISFSSEKKQNSEQIQRFQHQNKQLVQQLEDKQEEICSLKQQIQKMLDTMYKMSLEKAQMKESTPKFRSTSEENAAQRITDAEAMANFYKNQLEQLLRDNGSLNKELLQLKIRHSSEKQQLLDKISESAKSICSQKLKAPQKCQSCLQKDSQLSSLIRTNQQLSLTLNNVKTTIESVGYELKNGKIASLLDQNFTLYRKTQNQLTTEHQEYSQIVQAYQQKILNHEEEIASLQRQLGMKTVEIQLLEIELQKMKQINKQHQKNTLQTLKRNSNFMNREKSWEQSLKFKQNHTCVIEKLQENASQLSVLYQKVTNSLTNPLSIDTQSN